MVTYRVHIRRTADPFIDMDARCPFWVLQQMSWLDPIVGTVMPMVYRIVAMTFCLLPTPRRLGRRG